MLRVHPLGGRKAIIMFSWVECLGGFWAFAVLWVLGLRGCRVLGFLLVWSVLCILHVYLGVPYSV